MPEWDCIDENGGVTGDACFASGWWVDEREIERETHTQTEREKDTHTHTHLHKTHTCSFTHPLTHTHTHTHTHTCTESISTIAGMTIFTASSLTSSTRRGYQCWRLTAPMAARPVTLCSTHIILATPTLCSSRTGGRCSFTRSSS